MRDEQLLDEQVATAIRQVGAAEVMPRFRALGDGDVTEKAPGDLVTIADQECERVLTARLRDIIDIPVVGEEATAADSSLIDLLETAPAVWVTDPIDGTSNFVAGDPRFAVMVALVEHGETVAGWIWHPETDTMLSARKGQGVRRNGEPVAAPTRSAAPSGVLKRGYMDPAIRDRLGPVPSQIAAEVPAFKCAGMEYFGVVDGTLDFLFYWQTWPWDHAPGALIASEAGLQIGRPDGAAYRPGDGRKGLLTAVPELWDSIAAHIQTAIDG